MIAYTNNANKTSIMFTATRYCTCHNNNDEKNGNAHAIHQMLKTIRNKSMINGMQG